MMHDGKEHLAVGDSSDRIMSQSQWIERPAAPETVSSKAKDTTTFVAFAFLPQKHSFFFSL